MSEYKEPPGVIIRLSFYRIPDGADWRQFTAPMPAERREELEKNIKKLEGKTPHDAVVPWSPAANWVATSTGGLTHCCLIEPETGKLLGEGWANCSLSQFFDRDRGAQLSGRAIQERGKTCLISRF